MYEIRDGARILQFNGRKLGESSSWRRGSTRWIEFSLYKTENGSYILSRVGVSLVYHGAACRLAVQYKLKGEPTDSLSTDAVACQECVPNLSLPLVFPETHRYWAQVSEEAEAVLEALYKYDDGGARYLTRVAERLLENAATVDPDVARVYRVEMIP
jgi:hypothetical protein